MDAIPNPINANIYLTFIRPMNINTKHDVNKTAAVEKFAGNIKPHTMKIGTMMGKNADLKSFISSCFKDNILATYMIKPSFAKSEV